MISLFHPSIYSSLSISFTSVLSDCLLIFNRIFTNSITSSCFNDIKLGNSLVVQWLGLHAFTAVGLCSICSGGTKILQAAQCGQKKKKKRYKSWLIYVGGGDKIRRVLL